MVKRHVNCRLPALAHLDQLLGISKAVGHSNVEGDAVTVGALKHLEGGILSRLDGQLGLLEAIQATSLLKNNAAHGLARHLGEATVSRRKTQGCQGTAMSQSPTKTRCLLPMNVIASANP
jgi:hypothetical protein